MVNFDHPDAKIQINTIKVKPSSPFLYQDGEHLILTVKFRGKFGNCQILTYWNWQVGYGKLLGAVKFDSVGPYGWSSEHQCMKVSGKVTENSVYVLFAPPQIDIRFNIREVIFAENSIFWILTAKGPGLTRQNCDNLDEFQFIPIVSGFDFCKFRNFFWIIQLHFY